MSNERYKRIGEVSKLTGIPTRILRQWEKEFPMLKPVKRGGYRYYSEKDIELIFKIKELLYERKYTIEGAKKMLEAREKLSSQERGFLTMLRIIREELEKLEELLDDSQGERD